MKKTFFSALAVLVLTIVLSSTLPQQTDEYTLTVTADGATTFGMVQILDGVIGTTQDLTTPYEMTVDRGDVSYFVFKSGDPSKEIKVDARPSRGGGVMGQSSVVVIYANGDQMSTVAMD